RPEHIGRRSRRGEVAVKRTGDASKSDTRPPEFENYAVIRVLGEGGMGIVYLGHDVRADLPVAIKVMAKRLADPVIQRRFLQENEILSELNHRNIVRCFEIVRTRDGVPSIV